MPKNVVRHLARAGAVAVLAASVLLASGCAGTAARSDESGTAALDLDAETRPVVLTTFTVLADIAGVVAGDHLRVASITKFGAEIHGYEPTPDDITAAAHADLILDNGLGLEKWFEKFVSTSDAPHVTVSERITPIPIADGEAQGLSNPHAWMSALNAQSYVDVIADAFAELDPANAADYAANATAYKAELQAVHDELSTELATIPEAQRVLVTCEGAFSYLAADAGLDEQYLWPVNAESEATPRSLAATIDTVKERRVPAVFCESTVSDKTQRRVAEQADSSYGGVLYVDSLSAADGPVPSYLDLLRHDAATIVAGLTGAGPTGTGRAGTGDDASGVNR